MRGPREAADASVGVGASVGVAVRGYQRRLLDGTFLVGTAMTTPKLALSVLVVLRMVDVHTSTSNLLIISIAQFYSIKSVYYLNYLPCHISFTHFNKLK